MAVEQLRSTGLTLPEQALLNLTKNRYMRLILAANVGVAAYSVAKDVPAIHELVDDTFLSHFRGDKLISTDPGTGEIELGQKTQAPDNNGVPQSSGSETPPPTPEALIFPPTKTPEPPTPTPIPPTPTATPEPTKAPTLVPPTLTPEPTPTLIPPTRTPTLIPTLRPTEAPTPVPPTKTPEPTPKLRMHTVKPLLFVPKGLERPVQVDQEDLNNIEVAMKEVQKFTAEQLGGKTFAYEKPVLIRGQNNLRFYCPRTTSETQCIKPEKSGADPWEDIYGILHDIEKQNPTFHKMAERQVIVIFWVGGADFARGAGQNQDNGIVMLGDSWLKSIYILSAVGHEMGHGFGLDHTKADDTREGDKNFWKLSIMYDGSLCVWTRCQLLDSKTNPEKETLLKRPFMRHVINDSKK